MIRGLTSKAALAVAASDLLMVMGEYVERNSIRIIGLRAKAQTLAICFHQFEAALPYYAQAIELCKQQGDTLGVAQIEITRVWTLYQIEEFDSAEKAYLAAQATLEKHSEWQQLGLLHNNFAHICQVNGDNNRCLTLWKLALAAYDKADKTPYHAIISLQNNRVPTLQNLGRFLEALQAGEAALAFATTYHLHAEKNRALHNLGVTQWMMGNYNRSLKYLERASMGWLSDGRLGEAISLELGRIRCLMRLRRFQEVIDTGRRIKQEVQIGSFTNERLHINLIIAKAHLALVQRDEALDVLNTILASQTNASNLVFQARINLVRAAACLQANDPKNAVEIAKHAVAIFEQRDFISEMVEGLSIVVKGEIQQAHWQTAQNHVAKIQLLADTHDIQVAQYEAARLQGHIAHRLHDFERAISAYEMAIVKLNSLQRSVMMEHRPNFASDYEKQRLYNDMVLLCLQLKKVSDALIYAGRAKSQSLIDLLEYRVDMRVKPLDDDDQPLVNQLNQLRTEYSQLARRTELASLSPFAKSTAPTSEQRQLEEQITKLWHQLLIRNDAYVEDVTQGTFIHPHHLHIPSGVLLLEYFLIDDAVFLFLVSAETTQAHKLTISTTELRTLATLFQLNLSTVAKSHISRIDQLTKHAKMILHKLFLGLMQPVLRQIQTYEQLIVVPHKFLHYIPFHALYSGNTYLIETHNITYLPNIALLPHLSEPKIAQKSHLFAVGYSGEGALPNTQLEVQSITQQFQHKTLLLEQDATVSATLASLEQADIIHFATHGKFREDTPLFSGLLLADGLLTTFDIFSLRLKATLVTLSACHSGKSALGDADELRGLMYGFLSAGAKSLLLSHWSVEDRATTQLMNSIYRHLVTGVSLTDSLRMTQRAFIKQDDVASEDNIYWQHPFFWASFYLIAPPNLD